MDSRDYNHQWYQHFDSKRMLLIAMDPLTGDPVEIPAQYEVCDLCQGKGKHVNPSIDSHGISPDEFAEDPDFFEDYMRGAYDIPCNKCKGQRVVPVPLDNNEQVERILREHYQYQQEIAYQRRMGY